jgi:hypothetical protein
LNEECTAQVEALLQNRWLDGLFNSLEGRFPDARSEVGDAIAHAVENYVTLNPELPRVRQPEAYLFKASENRLKRLAKRREVSLDEILDDEDLDDAVSRRKRRRVLEAMASDSPEDRVEADLFYKALVSHVENWENDNIRTVTLTYLEAAKEGYALSSEDVAGVLEDILGYEVSPGSIRKWKERGFARLISFTADWQRRDALTEEET